MASWESDFRAFNIVWLLEQVLINLPNFIHYTLCIFPKNYKKGLDLYRYANGNIWNEC